MKILLYDIETLPSTAYVWKLWDQNINYENVIDEGEPYCITLKWYEDDELHTFDLTTKKGVKAAHAMLSKADVVVTFNGKNFDEKYMNTVFLVNDLPPPAPVKHIDLYKVVKQKFRFLSNKMGSVCQRLGLGHKLVTGGFDLWKRCVDGDEEARATMIEYNRQDVVLLEDLYTEIRPWITAHPNYNVYHRTSHSCPVCGSTHLQRRGTAIARSLTYIRYQCQDCGKWSTSNRAIAKSEEMPVG